MENLKAQLALIGLTETDIEEEILSTEDLINSVSSSSRLFRKTLKHIILREIKIYFNNETITLNDELKIFFLRKGRRTEWIKFSYYLDLKIPELKLTKLAIAFIVINLLGILFFIGWLIFRHEEFFIHSLISKITLIPLIFMVGTSPAIGIGALGKIVLPARTMDDFIDKIISKNFSDLLYDEMKRFKEIIFRELE